MGQCLSTTLKVVLAVSEATQQQEGERGASSSSEPHNQQQQQQKPQQTIFSSSPSSSSSLSPIYTSLPSSGRKTEQATVRNVYDGDTLTLTDGRRVRLLGIDTPELKEKQPFAQEARDYTKSHCENKTVYLQFDNGDTQDHYGRTLAHVYVKDSKSKNKNGTYHYLCVNEGIVAAGLASAYCPSQDKKTNNYDKLIKLQAQARAQGLGIHAAGLSAASGGSGSKDKIVVKTKNGSAYHDKSCKHLEPNWRLEELTMSEAQDKGLHACRTCLS
jgi:micrococcal nuclease